jgi:ankyrin repeat protein
MDESLDDAIHHGSLAEIRRLIDLGADPGYESDEGYPSLLSALAAERADKYQVLEILIDAGADVNQRGINDWTPLHYAASQDDVRAIEILVARGADLNARTRIDDCATPLEEAKILGKGKAVAALRRLGAEQVTPPPGSPG